MCGASAMTNQLLVQLAALSVHMDAVAQAIRAEVNGSLPVGPEPGSCPQCGASPDRVEDSSTIGQKSSRCTVCGAEWDR